MQPKAISFRTNNGRQIELKVYGYITIEEQLCLWHAEVCCILGTKCRYEWSERLDSYRCLIGLPQIGRLHLSSLYNHSFWKALAYAEAYKTQAMTELLPKLSMLLAKEDISLLLEYMLLRGEGRTVEFEVSKTVIKREITYEDVMCEKKAMSVIEEPKCLPEYIIRKKNEANEKELAREEYWRNEELKQYYGHRLATFLQERKTEYAKASIKLKIGKFFSIIPWGIIGALKVEKDVIQNRFNSLYYLLDQIDSKGKKELSYFLETTQTDLLWAYVVMYAATEDVYYQFDAFGGCYEIKRGIYRDYIGRYIKQEYESIIKAIKENRNACRKK